MEKQPIQAKERIEAGTMGRPVGKKDMAFCLIYSDETYVYTKYSEFLKFKDINEEIYNKRLACTPRVFMQMRWDGKLGFPGGFVDSDDKTLRDAIKRELKEEIALVDIDESRLKLLSTFADKKSHITAFCYKVTQAEMDVIEDNSRKAEHYGVEVDGTIRKQILDGYLKNLYSQMFSGTGRLELELLINEKHLLIDEKMKNKAIEMAKPYFLGIKRDNGNDYFEEHIMGTVNMVKNYPLEYQIVLTLHDIIEDTIDTDSPVTVEDLKREFPEFIVEAVQCLTIDKNAVDQKAEVGKCTKSHLTRHCRYIDRLNNLEHTSYTYNDQLMVEKMIYKTQANFLPWFNEEERASIVLELDRIDSEKNKPQEA